MKLRFLGIAFIGILTAAHPVMARDFQNGISYLDSTYFKDGILPFEKCDIRHSLELSSYNRVIGSQAYTEFKKPSIGLIVPVKKLDPLHADYYLTCWVGVSTLAFAIPVHMGDLEMKGFSLGLMGNVLKISFDHLDGKQLWEVEGSYSGFLRAAGLLAVGGKYANLKNSENEIRIKIKGWYAGLLGLELGRGELKLGLGRDAPNLVDKTDKDKIRNIPDLMNFRFMKVDWTDVRKLEQTRRDQVIKERLQGKEKAEPTAGEASAVKPIEVSGVKPENF